MNWPDTLLNKDSKIIDAINCLEKSSLQIVMVVDDNSMLIGTISDGDIRRGFLNSCNLDTPVISILNPSPIVVNENIDPKIIISLMDLNRIRQIPVVNSSKQVLGLHCYDDFIKSSRAITNQILIMAGGFGKRLYPLTNNCPKPMLEVGDKPILEHILLRCIDNGFSNFIISLHYLPDMIMNYFQDGSRWGVNIEYIIENAPLGTAGVLSLIKNIPSQPIVITNGDLFTDINYSDILNYHIETESVATMAVRRYEIQNPYGAVRLNDRRIVGIDEKPVYSSIVNAGVYVLSPSILSKMNTTIKIDMPDLFTQLINGSEDVNAYFIHEPWVDIGQHSDLEAVRDNLRLQNELSK